MTRHDRIIANLRRHGALATVQRICDRACLSLTSVLGDGRRPATVRARHEAWSVISGTLGLSLSEAADMFQVDHTTILSALRTRALFFSTSYPTCSPVTVAGVRGNIATEACRP